MRRSGSESDEVGSNPAPPANSSYSILLRYEIYCLQNNKLGEW